MHVTLLSLRLCLPITKTDLGMNTHFSELLLFFFSDLSRDWVWGCSECPGLIKALGREGYSHGFYPLLSKLLRVTQPMATRKNQRFCIHQRALEDQNSSLNVICYERWWEWLRGWPVVPVPPLWNYLFDSSSSVGRVCYWACLHNTLGGLPRTVAIDPRYSTVF